MPRLYEAWPGNQTFYCNCCVCGPKREISTFLTWFFCSLVIGVPFSIYVIPHVWHKSPLLPVLFYFVLTLTTAFLILAATTDPGIIPHRAFLERDSSNPAYY